MTTITPNRLGLWLSLLLGGSLAALSAAAQEGSATAADGSVEAGRTKSMTCAACHGVDGNSVTPDWPMLAGQHASYIVRQLRAFKNGERTDVTMKPFADMLSDQEMLDVAAYFAAQTPTPKGADPALVSLGQQIYRGGVPARAIAACIACHGPDGSGNPLASYPRVSGQHATYVTKQLNAYRAGDRTSDVEFDQMMRNVARTLLD